MRSSGNMTSQKPGSLPPDRSGNTRRSSVRQRRALLGESDLESGLTDVRAEIYLLEAERLRVTRELAELDVAASDEEGRVVHAKLTQRQNRIEERLEALEATSAGLRAQLEEAQRSRAGGRGRASG